LEFLRAPVRAAIVPVRTAYTLFFSLILLSTMRSGLGKIKIIVNDTSLILVFFSGFFQDM